MTGEPRYLRVQAGYRGRLGVEVGVFVAVVRALRRNGYGVHLATNQERYRAAYLRDVLGYDALFDVSCYSCELGLAKPAPAFFAEAVRRIGAEPPAVLFIDDSAGNVEGARAAGLAAGQWSLEQGHDALARLLARHGVAALPGLAPLPGAPNTTFRERSATFWRVRRGSLGPFIIVTG
jgi:putative hydrolase of the HAD superfamily